MNPSSPARPVLTYAEATEIVELLRSASAFTEFRLRSGDLEIEVRRGAAPAPAPAGAAAAAPAAPAPALPATPAPPAALSAAPPAAQPAAPLAAPLAAPSAAPSAPAPAAAAVGPAHSDRAVLITSPMVGTFYRSPEPGAPPFVEVGQAVEPDTTVCIIEVMKLMNTLPAGCRGVVTQVRVGDGEAVEYGQVLVVIEPS